MGHAFQTAEKSPSRSPGRTSSHAPMLIRQPVLTSQGLLQPKADRCVCGGSCPRCRDRLPLQTKLAISEPGDVYEQEADRVADEVMRMSARPAVSDSPPRIQRFAGKGTGHGEAAPASVDKALSSPGTPLEPMLRQDMEQRFGHDFSRVRVHADPGAASSAESIGARAYTAGHHVVFGAGEYRPGAADGRRLLAHVAQQKAHGLESLQRRRGTGVKKTFHGITFEEDANGRLILTNKILLDAMKDSYDTHLKSVSRFSGLGTVQSVMSVLDTTFYDISQDTAHKHDRFVYLELDYSAEQVNYIGVGMGFEHFHIFLHRWEVAHLMVQAWNLKKYSHAASPGEHFWAQFGMSVYDQV